MPAENLPTPYKPSGWYFRKALRETETQQDAVEIGMQLVAELEMLKAFIRANGMIPPKSNILDIEALDKGWNDQLLIPLESPPDNPAPG